ncbi:hypothetical protein C8A06_0693 [Microbacteriaceae bacterium MWH-Ta3]|nr:hypothetical protein C8A06_0693 [Microbacteriaceae bacterium MWH-Ta3]
MSKVVSRSGLFARVAVSAAIIGAVTVATGVPSGAATATDSTLGIVLPVTVAAGGDLLTLDELTEAVAPGGRLAHFLELVEKYDVTVALDSRISASITALGDTAPADVLAWHTRMITEPNLVLLPWSNGDPLVLAADDDANRVTAEELAGASGVSAIDITGWLSESSLPADTAEVLSGLGYQRVLISDAVYSGERHVLSSAASARASAATAEGSTANISVTAASLAATGRNVPTWFALSPTQLDLGRAEALLRVLAHDESVTIEPVASLPVRELTNALPVVSFDGDAALAEAFTRFRKDRSISTMGEDSTVLLYPRIRALSALASTTRIAGFESRVTDFVATSIHAERAVSINPASAYTVLASQAAFPVTLINDHATPVTVNLQVRSTSGIVTVTDATQLVTIPGNSSTQVTVPLQVVSNGSAQLEMDLRTPEGVPLASVARFDITVAAQWEAMTLVSFSVVVVTILGLGVVRTVRRRRVAA